jgi:hypothetical protein
MSGGIGGAIVLVVIFKILMRLLSNKLDTGSALHFGADGHGPLRFGNNQPRPNETIEAYYLRMDGITTADDLSEKGGHGG